MGPEWISTSDLMTIDADGFLFCIGRADGAIKRGGFKVLSETVDRVLRLHKAVAVPAEIAANDPILREVSMAIIQLKRGMAPPDADALKAHVRHHLPAPHVPAEWRFVETKPLNSTYKIDRAALRKRFAAVLRP
jgi:acyl-CoA synthetase (AMP-forming)/AMP-acid ligase II